jgi:TRAP-type transport system periplasmic protein
MNFFWNLNHPLVMKSNLMKLNRRSFLHTATLAGAALAFPSVSRGAAAKINIRLATIAFEGTSFHQNIQLLADDWQKLSGGEVKLSIFAGGSMGDEADVVRKIRNDRLQAGMLTSVGLAEVDRSITALQLMPLMFKTWEEVDYVREKLRARLERTFADKGFTMLFWADAGWVRYFARKPAVTPTDLKPLKVWAMRGDTEGFELMKHYYQPVQLNAKDILTSLETQMVEVVPIVPVLANAGQFVTVAKHMIDLRWVPVVGATIVQRKIWETIPADVRAKLAAAAEKRGAEVRQQSRKEDELAIAAMQKRGLQVHPVNAAAQAEWDAVAKDSWPKIRGKIVPADLFDEVQRLLADFRSAKKGA